MSAPLANALEFRRFRKREDCQASWATGAEGEESIKFKGHTFKGLVDWVAERQIPGDFAFDCYFTNAEVLNHIASSGRGYVGGLKFN